MKGSYHFSAVHQDSGGEIARLDAQTQLSWREELRIFESIGLQNGAAILDAGSGPGFVAERLRAACPTSLITSLEIDPEMIAIARARASRSGSGIEAVRGDVYATGLTSNRFDFVLARLIFQHLRDPDAAAQELKRVLAPGGTLAISDIDAGLWGIAEPYFPEAEPVYRAFAEVQERDGGNRTIGRRLFRILSNAGFASVRLDAFVYHSDEIGVERFIPQISPDRLAPLVREGLLAEADLARAKGAFKRFLAAEDPYVLMVGFVASGVKPRL